MKLEKSPKATLWGGSEPAKGQVRKARGSQAWPCPAHYCNATWAASPVVPSEQGPHRGLLQCVLGGGGEGRTGEDHPSTVLNWQPPPGLRGLLDSAKQTSDPFILLPTCIDFFPTVTSLQIQRADPAPGPSCSQRSRERGGWTGRGRGGLLPQGGHPLGT